MKERMIQLTKSIAGDMLMLTKTLLETNDLRNSTLNKDVQTRIREQNNPVIDVLFNDYLNYIETGRKPRTGKMPRFSALREWAIKKGIPADNSTLFLIARSIWQNGIAARPLLATLEEEIEKRFLSQWSDRLAEHIIKEVDNVFV